MSSKDSKVPIYIAIVVAIILIAAGGYYVLGNKIPAQKPGDVIKATPVATIEETTVTTPQLPEKTSTASQTPVVAAAPPKSETIKCELCHKESQNLIPHINGGKLCVTCHTSQVHDIHIGPGTVGLECNACHGSPPVTPSVDKSAVGPGHYSVCENCHAAPPDSLKPSKGDLITIHLSRKRLCTDCHATDIGDIHKSKLENATK